MTYCENTTVCDSGVINEAIPQQASTPLISSFSISGTLLTGSFRVQTFIPHVSSGQLSIWLTSPWNETFQLATEAGGSRRNYFNGTVWDNGAKWLASDTDYRLNGLATVLRPASQFTSGDPNGVWSLGISDNLWVGAGSLLRWVLDFSRESHLLWFSISFGIQFSQPPPPFW